MKALADLLQNLAPLITAMTPVLLILVNWFVTRRQSVDLKSHSDENAAKITSTVEATGTHKTLPDA